MPLARNRFVNLRPKQQEYYKGLLVHADTGLHEQLVETFRAYVAPEATVLDVGAGAGALSLRLHDAGYRVTALDVDPDEFAPRDEVSFSVLDINQGISSETVGGPFDAACCVEVIEHVENPWRLLREIAAVVRPGGTLVVSTPNVTSFLSRLMFLLRGRFHQFGAGDLSYGHINPVTEFELGNIARNTGWTVRETRPGGYLPVLDLGERNPKMLLLNLLRLPAWALSRGDEKRGWCIISVLERTG
jgi:2-polyprenyl-3-methyl-5-hydroxy-6-metoxy-1,4-benzoquinol methylase